MPEFVPVRGLLRMVAALSRRETGRQRLRGAAAAQRLPPRRVLDHHHDRGAVLPPRHHGHQRAARPVQAAQGKGGDAP